MPFVPPNCERADVYYVPLHDQKGIAQSRNTAIAMTLTPFLLFGDDDVTLDIVAVSAVCDYLAANTGLAMATGRISGPGRRAAVVRPSRLRRTNTAHIGTPELMIRPDVFRAKGMGFDGGFGLGSANPLGDEFILLVDALNAGLSGMALPYVIGHHPTQSSGGDWTDPVRLRARAVVLRRVFGRMVLPYAVAFGIRHRKRLGGIGGVWRFIRQCVQPSS